MKTTWAMIELGKELSNCFEQSDQILEQMHKDDEIDGYHCIYDIGDIVLFAYWVDGYKCKYTIGRIVNKIEVNDEEEIIDENDAVFGYEDIRIREYNIAEFNPLQSENTSVHYCISEEAIIGRWFKNIEYQSTTGYSEDKGHETT